MPYPPKLTAKELIELFPVYRDNPIKPGVFELGLCLGGTVSAGAYVGGVLDYLLEALDAWALAKQRELPEAPKHEVVISTIAGTSGGGINGAILARAAGWEFDHAAAPDNPFYVSWTSVNLMSLLARGGPDGFVSLFNCDPITDQAKATVAWRGRPLGSGNSPSYRSYLADPLRLFMMVANVTGLPYGITFSGESGLGHGLVAHGDFVRFGLEVERGVPNPPAARPDELALAVGLEANWDHLAQAALATSAFPLAFQSRSFSRGLAAAGYRAVAVPTERGEERVVQLIPQWDALAAGEANPDVTNFVNVDGGAANNEPLDIVRTTLAGLGGRNSRKPGEADRAVILIDPFSDPEMLGPRVPPPLTKLALPFIQSLVYQARYKPVDIALAYDEDIYSRYLIAPVGPGPDNRRTIGTKAIASGGLGGFLGFVDTSFLRYDFALGRRNAHGFLKQHLALPEAAKNPIFNSWTEAQRDRYRFHDKAGTAYLPLIPLMPTLRQEPEIPAWPTIRDVPPGLSDAIAARLDTVYKLAKSQALPSSPLRKAAASLYLELGWRSVRGALRDGALNIVRKGLRDHRLLAG